MRRTEAAMAGHAEKMLRKKTMLAVHPHRFDRATMRSIRNNARKKPGYLLGRNRIVDTAAPGGNPAQPQEI